MSDRIPNAPDSFLCLIKLHILISCAKTSFSNEIIYLYGTLPGNPGVQKVAEWGAEKKTEYTEAVGSPHLDTSWGIASAKGQSILRENDVYN